MFETKFYGIISYKRKRKAELSPIKNERVKRSALGNLTNAVIATDSDENIKKGTQAQVTKKDDFTRKTLQNVNLESIVPRIQPISSRTRAAAKVQPKTVSKKGTKNLCELLPPPQLKLSESNSKSKANEVSVITTALKSKQAAEVSVKTSRRISNEFEKTEESLYVSALEDIPSDVSRLSSDAHRGSRSKHDSNICDETLSPQSTQEKCESDEKRETAVKPPPGVEDFDKENWNDPYQVSNYAMNIFDYLKQREIDYKIKDYMSDQPELSKWMRSLLVDWMVEVQESFELNHETLYLAVKIVDTYLGKERVSKDALQLLGAASLLIACKYDVRIYSLCSLTFLKFLSPRLS